MTRYATVPWPWVGLVLTLALLGQEILFRWFGSDAVAVAVARTASR